MMSESLSQLACQSPIPNRQLRSHTYKHLDETRLTIKNKKQDTVYREIKVCPQTA
jgi:hypothetical protein